MSEQEQEIDHLLRTVVQAAHEIQQILGKALGYPELYPKVSQCNDGTVCVGDSTPESLAEEAAKEMGTLRASLGRAMEALQKIEWSVINHEEARCYCPDCDHSQHEGHHRDCKLASVLSDPTGQQAVAERQAMVDLAKAAEEMSNALIQLEHADPQEGALFEWADKVEAKFHAVVGRLVEVQKHA